MAPINFLKRKGISAYLDTGYFAQKVIAEARHFGKPVVAASYSDKGYNYIPDHSDVPNDPAYLHITSEKIIEGTEQFEFNASPAVPLICDMFSDIFDWQNVSVDKPNRTLAKIQ